MQLTSSAPTSPCWQLAQSRTLIRAGFSLLLFAMIVGLLVPLFADPKRAVSAHVLGIVQGILLAVAGQIWPRLAFPKPASIAATALLLYGCVAAWLANLGAAAWRAGGATLPLVEARGSAGQELAIAIGLRSSAVALVCAVVLALVGLCHPRRARAITRSRSHGSACFFDDTFDGDPARGFRLFVDDFDRFVDDVFEDVFVDVFDVGFDRGVGFVLAIGFDGSFARASATARR